MANFLKSAQFALFFLEALSQTVIVIKSKSAVGYDEVKLSKKIINELHTRKVLETDLAKWEDRISALEQQVQFLTYKYDEHEQYSRRTILEISDSKNPGKSSSMKI